MGYSALVLLPTDTATPLDQAEQRLRAFFNDAPARPCVPDIVRHQSALQLLFCTWSLSIGLAADPHILREAQEITALLLPSYPDLAYVATYAMRLEITTDLDPMMEHFNDYLLTLEQLAGIPGAVLLDPYTQDRI
jgi:hypothetical protein